MVSDSKTEILTLASELGIRLINLQFTDILGTLKSVVIPMSQLESALEDGVWFDGSSIEGFARIHESDMYLNLLPETFAVLPWVSKENPTARFICDVYGPGGNPFDGCPRNVLKRTLEKAEKMGYAYNTGPELEFFLFNRGADGEFIPKPTDNASYFDMGPRDSALSVRREITYALEKFRIDVETSHHEVAGSQHEISFAYSDALRTADNAQTFKHTVKSIANLRGLHATFMPKPIEGVNGSGMHVHQSLFDLQGNTAFFDKDREANLSITGRNFIAGQLNHIKEITAALNPLVNSYKRLVPGYEAPVYICWGQRNRSALIRVPRYKQGKEKAMRIELRSADPSANPYLAFSLMLAAGLEGIKNKMEPPEPTSDDVYKYRSEELNKNSIDTLPGSLQESLELFRNSKLVKETLGGHIFEKYIEAKELEWASYNKSVSKWELDRYLERI